MKIKKVCVHTCDQSETLHTCEVGMLNGHDPSLSEQLLWIVIDQLSVEEEEEAMETTAPSDGGVTPVCVCVYLLMKQLIPCFKILSTFSFIFSFSASSISATFAVESTRTLDPKI